MTTAKQGRGRPVGTGLDDSATLCRMADLILTDPRLRPTTALKRIVENPGPSFVRRLQVKWRAASPRYLAEARARQAMATRVSTPPRQTSGLGQTRLPPLEQAYADLGLGTLGRRRRPESTIERAMREANEQMQSLVGGYGSSACRLRRDARVGALPSAARDAALGVDKFIAEAIGCGKGSASLRSALGTDRASRVMQEALGIDRRSIAMRAALGLDSATLMMREASRRSDPFF